MSEPTGSGPPGPAAPQRRWQAPCPNCGAPVAFASAASAAAICQYCRSSVLRDGESLRKIGQSAELFADHTALQLGASGRWQERGFTLVGRVQYGYGGAGAKAEAGWSEWHALFDDGASGWLSEDNDQYVMAFAVQPDTPAPGPKTLRLYQVVGLARKQWRVAALNQCRALAAEGELPRPPALGREFLIADLRNAQNQVATLEYADENHPGFSVGVPVRLQDLALRGLRRDAGTLTLQSQGFPCPNCGAPVEPKLSASKSISCGACHSVIDLSKGVGAQLAAFQQQRRFTPRIPLGRSGRLAVAGMPVTDWQVVGFAWRRGVGDGTFTWGDYLLYNEQAGFAFLNDTEDGWVGWRTLTGIPGGRGDNPDLVLWEGKHYRLVEAYSTEALYVEGEFYWQVRQGQRSRNFDYAGAGADSGRRLSREQAENEVIWSQGAVLPAAALAAAFNLTLEERKLIRPDASPLSEGSQFSLTNVIGVVVLIVVLLIVLRACDDDGGYYGTGGSYGGYSSGGGHK